MAEGTVPIAITSPGTSALSYTVPANQVLNLQAVRAVFDGTAAAGAFLPAVQIVNTNGAVMAQTIGSSVAAGGNADASFFRGVRSTSGTSPTISYPELVLSSTGLLAYWRLGEVASPFADTSGRFPATPGDANVVVRGTAYTTHVTGALPPGVDDGACQFNGEPTTGYYLQATHGSGGRYDFGPSSSKQSVAAWVKPTNAGGTYVAAIISNYYSSPATGWFFGIDFPSTALYFERSSSLTYKTTFSTGLTFGAWNHVAATYDGSNTTKLYINGALVKTNAASSVPADVFNNGPQIGGGHPNASDDYMAPGVVDEVSLWDVVLTPDFIALLASLG